MPNCAVYGCKNHNRKNDGGTTKFYTFPKNEDLALRWMQACGRQDEINLKNAVICSKHFKSKWFVVSLKYKLLNEAPPKRFRNLHEDAVPTLFLPHKNVGTSVENFSSKERSCPSSSSSKRLQRMQAQHDVRNRDLMFEEIWLKSDNDGYTDKQAESQIPVGEQFMEESCENINELKEEIEHLKIMMLTLQKEVEILKSKNEKLAIHKAAAESKLAAFNTALKNHFTPGQIKRILNPNKK